MIKKLTAILTKLAWVSLGSAFTSVTGLPIGGLIVGAAQKLGTGIGTVVEYASEHDAGIASHQLCTHGAEIAAVDKFEDGSADVEYNFDKYQGPPVETVLAPFEIVGGAYESEAEEPFIYSGNPTPEEMAAFREDVTGELPEPSMLDNFGGIGEAWI